MAASNPWPLIHGGREALVADLAVLTDRQWATGSLCPGWPVRDVLGHLIATAKMTPGGFFVNLAADFFEGPNLLIGSKRRIAGLGLRASDLEWAVGSGPDVTGPALSLLMAMTGRAAALDDLSGEGVATLRTRR